MTVTTHPEVSGFVAGTVIYTEEGARLIEAREAPNCDSVFGGMKA